MLRQPQHKAGRYVDSPRLCVDSGLGKDDPSLIARVRVSLRGRHFVQVNSQAKQQRFLCVQMLQQQCHSASSVFHVDLLAGHPHVCMLDCRNACT